MTTFLPLLKKELKAKQWATSGMLHQEAKSKIKLFAEQTSEQYVFVVLMPLRRLKNCW